MNESEIQKLTSTDVAIQECERYIKYNKETSVKILVAITVIVSSAVLLVWSLLQVGYTDLFIKTSFGLTVLYAILAATGVSCAILLSFYRFYAQEISKIEFFKLGFMRISIAARNRGDGYQEEVRQALTYGAFTYQPTASAKKGNVESPLPGYPTSDVATALVNKLLDGIDVVVKAKTRT